MMVCQQCGASLIVRRTIDLTRKKFCSSSCRARANAWRLPKRFGVRPWNFKGGFIDQRGYHRVYTEGKDTYAHRIVMGAPEGLVIHHANGNKSDNRPENLVAMTQSDHLRQHLLHGLAQQGAQAMWAKQYQAKKETGQFPRSLTRALNK